jgi:hypothetical protein
MQLTSSNKSVLYQLLYTLSDGILGRRTLVDKTGITEMTTRTYLNKLRNLGWVKMEKAGTSLTSKAKHALVSYFDSVDAIHHLNLSGLTLYPANASALLKSCGNSLENSLFLRDAAVRAGAAGALFLVMGKAGWMFSEEDALLAENFADETKVLGQHFDAHRGDLLVIAFGTEMSQARSGLWSVIAELVPIEFE